jgi:hypothetical protein
MRFGLAFFLMVLMTGLTAAQSVPRPQMKPETLNGATTRPVPRPQLKPAPPPQTTPPAFPAGSGGWDANIVASERQACAGLLKGMDLDYQGMAPLGEDGGCGAPAPILIREIAGVAIKPPMEATCDLAASLHGWITSSLQPAARAQLGADPSLIENASAYVCRRRNNQATGKLSEHARANALDIARIRFTGGGSTSVAGDWSGVLGSLGVSAKAAFLAQIRRDACIRFTTVLGPGSDSFHKDHFHIDMARRRNGYRICQ